MPDAQLKRRLALFAGVALVLTLTACAHQPPGTPGAPALFSGLWHGLIAPISFVISLFDSDVRMYAFPNDGRWYDFGFLIGLGCWGGGGSAAASRK